jgi:hypothetical protein
MVYTQVIEGLKIPFVRAPNLTLPYRAYLSLLAKSEGEVLNHMCVHRNP